MICTPEVGNFTWVKKAEFYQYADIIPIPDESSSWNHLFPTDKDFGDVVYEYDPSK